MPLACLGYHTATDRRMRDQGDSAHQKKSDIFGINHALCGMDIPPARGNETTGGYRGTTTSLARRFILVGFRRGIRSLLIVAVVFCAYLAARQGIAAYHFRRGQPDDLREAIRFDPRNPEYPDDLASLTHLYSDSANADLIVALYKTSTRLSPYNSQYWSDLASGYEWAGREKDALDALQHAIDLFPNSPDLNWKLANFYIRQGRLTDGLHSLRAVLMSGEIPSNQVFFLAARATRDDQAIVNEMIPPQGPLLIDYLDYQSEAGNLVAAEHAWKRLLELHLPFALQQALPYIEVLIDRRDLDTLVQTWSDLRERFPSEMGPRITEGNLITNGSFQSDFLNGGLDWRAVPTDGVTVSIDKESEGGHSLEIEFDGSRNENYSGVLQIVPVKPSTKYVFSAIMRGQQITTDSGPRFEILDPDDTSRLFVSGKGLVGSTADSRQELRFSTSPQTRLVVVRIARPPSNRFDNKISGTAWFSDVRLSPEN